MHQGFLDQSYELCPGGGAQRGGVEIRELKTVLGQGIKVRSVHFTAVCAQVRVAQVIEENHEDVWRLLRLCRAQRFLAGGIGGISARDQTRGKKS